MSDCHFNIPFQGSLTEAIAKARSAVEKQGGNFTGDENSGKFDVSVMGNNIIGIYTAKDNKLELTIQNKPFIIPCSAIEAYLTKQLS